MYMCIMLYYFPVPRKVRARCFPGGRVVVAVGVLPTARPNTTGATALVLNRAWQPCYTHTCTAGTALAGLSPHTGLVHSCVHNCAHGPREQHKQQGP